VTHSQSLYKTWLLAFVQLVNLMECICVPFKKKCRRALMDNAATTENGQCGVEFDISGDVNSKLQIHAVLHFSKAHVTRPAT
jgi:hypothetical protein